MLSFLAKRTAPPPEAHDDDADPGGAPPMAAEAESGLGWVESDDIADDRPSDHGGRNRELCTADPTPGAPRAQALLAEPGLVIDRTLAIWDPHCLWPADVLGRLATPSQGRFGTTRLRLAAQPRAFAEIQHGWVRNAAGETTAILCIQGRADSATSTPVALMLLEASQYAAIVTGSAGDRDLPRRLQEFVQQASWRGPAIHLLTLAGKPARAEKLKRLGWPRRLKVKLTDYLPASSRPWLQECLMRLVPDLTSVPDGSLDLAAGTETEDSPAAAAQAVLPSAAGSGAAASSPPAALAPADPGWAVLPGHDGTSADPVDPGEEAGGPRLHAAVGLDDDAADEPLSAQTLAAELLDEALRCTHCCGGVAAAAILDLEAGWLLRASGDLDLSRDAARLILRQHRLATPAPTPPSAGETQLAWTRGAHTLLAAPVPQRPGWCLIAVAAGPQVDLRQMRWQLQVAGNGLAPFAA